MPRKTDNYNTMPDALESLKALQEMIAAPIGKKRAITAKRWLRMEIARREAEQKASDFILKYLGTKDSSGLDEVYKLLSETRSDIDPYWIRWNWWLDNNGLR